MSAKTPHSNKLQAQAKLLPKQENHTQKDSNATSIRSRHNSLQRWSEFLFVLLTSAIFAVTTWFARGMSSRAAKCTVANAYETATFSEQSTTRAEQTIQKTLRIDVGSTLTVLSILSGLLTASTTYVLCHALECVLWASTSSRSGLNCLSLLAISPTTGTSGTLGILLSGMARYPSKSCALLRLVSVFLKHLCIDKLVVEHVQNMK